MAEKGASTNAMMTIRGLPTIQKVALVVAANAAVWSDNHSDARKWRRVTHKRATLGDLYWSFQRMRGQLLISSLSFSDFVDFCSGALMHHRLLDIAYQLKKVGREKYSKNSCVYIWTSWIRSTR